MCRQAPNRGRFSRRSRAGGRSKRNQETKNSPHVAVEFFRQLGNHLNSESEVIRLPDEPRREMMVFGGQISAKVAKQKHRRH